MPWRDNGNGMAWTSGPVEPSPKPRPPPAPAGWKGDYGRQRNADHQGEVTGSGSKLFVGCLPYSKTEADLEPVFAQFGALVEVAILKDPSTGNSKGAGFVTYQDEASAMTAMAFLQGHVLEGATRGMNLSFATSTGGPRGNSNNANWRPPQPPMHPPVQAGEVPLSQMSQINQLGQMAPQAHGNVCPPGSKVFVGQLPYSRTEADLLQLFSSVGPVVEVLLLKDKKTQEKKGAAFVRFQTPQHAAAAAAALNGFLFSGSTRPITVSIAQSSVGDGVAMNSLGTMSGAANMGEQGQHPNVGQKRGPAWAAPSAQAVHSEPGAKLFVGQLPFSRNEEDLRQLFSQYGPVAEVLLHRDVQGQKKGGAFVRYQSAVNAQAALDLDGYMFQGSTRPITVAIAGEGVSKKRRTE